MTREQRTQQALSMFEALKPEIREQLLEVLRALKKAQDNGTDAQMRAAIDEQIQAVKAG